MNTPDVPSPGAPGGSHRVTFPALPEGTILLTIGRVLAGTHQRGGRREHVARIAPAKLRSSLVALGPGRYRVASIDLRGCFLRGGSFCVEVPAGTLEPVVVPPRVPGDYPRRPSTTAARRGTQRIKERVRALQTHLREAYAANAQLERDVVAQQEKHLKEALGGHESLETLRGQVERLVNRVKELEARQDTQHRNGRQGLAEVREGLALERRQREADVARLAASALPPGGAPLGAEQTPPEPVVEGQRSAPIDSARSPLGEAPLASAPPSEVHHARTPGFAALADVRVVPRRNPAPTERPTAPPAGPPLTYGESLESFLSQRPPRPK